LEVVKNYANENNIPVDVLKTVAIPEALNAIARFEEKIQLEDISGWKLAVDGYNTLYQFLAIIRGMDGGHLKDSKGRVTSHISGLFYRNVNLMELGIKLVYVFDGKPPELKTEEIERRSAQRREAKDLKMTIFDSANEYKSDALKELGEAMTALATAWPDARLKVVSTPIPITRFFGLKTRSIARLSLFGDARTFITPITMIINAAIVEITGVR